MGKCPTCGDEIQGPFRECRQCASSDQSKRDAELRKSPQDAPESSLRGKQTRDSFLTIIVVLVCAASVFLLMMVVAASVKISYEVGLTTFLLYAGAFLAIYLLRERIVDHLLTICAIGLVSFLVASIVDPKSANAIVRLLFSPTELVALIEELIGTLLE